MKTLFAAVAGLGLVVAAGTPAVAGPVSLTEASSYFVGAYVPGEPASEVLEATYINHLITLATSSTDTEVISSKTFEFYRSGNTFSPALTSTSATGAVKQDSEIGDPKAPNPNFTPSSIDVTGFTYLIGKYDGPNGGTMVFRVSNIDFTGYDLNKVSLPGNYDPPGGKEGQEYGLSHYTLFKVQSSVPDPAPTPDGGATLALLGSALVGIGALRRKFLV